MSAITFLTTTAAAVVALLLPSADAQPGGGGGANNNTSNLGACTHFNMTTGSYTELSIDHFASVFYTTECMRVTVHSYEPTADVWNLVCFGDFRGEGMNQTAIPKSMCDTVTVPIDTTIQFKMEYTVCNDNCTLACECIDYDEIELPALTDYYQYKAAECSTDSSCPVGPTPHPTLSMAPSSRPSDRPSITLRPSSAPSVEHSTFPSPGPTLSPSSAPSAYQVPNEILIFGTFVTGAPSQEPSSTPSAIPTSLPSSVPTDKPSNQPSRNPSLRPTPQPTNAPTPRVPCGNQVFNPNFNSGIQGWNVMNGGTSTVSYVWDGGLGNTGAIQITGRSSSWEGIAQDMSGVLRPGATYTISFWVDLNSCGLYCTTPAQPIGMTLRMSDDTGDAYNSHIWGTATTSWGQISGEITLPPQTGTLTGILMYIEGPAAGINYRVDDVSIVPTTYFEPNCLA